MAASGAIRILGIDPGSITTGLGVIDVTRGKLTYVAHVSLATGGGDFNDRLLCIFQGVTEVMTTYQPQEVAVEKVFMSRNADSALKLGHARGAAIVAAGRCPIAEYTPRAIKQALVGGGGADKRQVQHMVGMLLRLSDPLQADAADALATAICHAHHRETAMRMKVAR